MHEFPSRADVKDTSDTPAELRNIGQEVAQEVLLSPLPEYKLSSPMKGMSTDTCPLRIAKVKPAGDVLHIFSHIRKTYRVQWVLLEGGGEPPELNPAYQCSTSPPEAEEKPNAKAKSKAKVSDTKVSAKSKNKEQSPSVRWVRYEDVEEAK